VRRYGLADSAGPRGLFNRALQRTGMRMAPQQDPGAGMLCPTPFPLF